MRPLARLDAPLDTPRPLISMHANPPLPDPLPSRSDSRRACLLLCMKLMHDVDVDDAAVASHTRPCAGEDGLGDVGGDGNDGDLADYAAKSLHDLAQVRLI